MNRFKATLVPGNKPPYSTWTFLVIPPEVASEWGLGQKPVRGTISGIPFQGTASKGEGVLRMPIPIKMREQLAVRSGDLVEVEIELDIDPRPIRLPDELLLVFSENPDIEEIYDQLPPSLQRAWTSYVDDAKRQETRKNRAWKALDGIRTREYPR